MNDFPNVQPDRIEHRGHAVEHAPDVKTTGLPLPVAVVRIRPGADRDVDFALGYGPNEYAAKADAFRSARRYIDGLKALEDGSPDSVGDGAL